MTAHALISGALHNAPESRISKNGNAYATATVRVSVGNEIQFWRIFAFSESARDELMRLREGDVLAAQGSLKAEVYTSRDGEARISYALTADHVLALRQPPKQRERKVKSPKQECSREERRVDADLNDDIGDLWGGPP